MKYKSKFILLSLLIAFIIAGCGSDKTDLKIDFEKYTLENGLEVIHMRINLIPLQR